MSTGTPGAIMQLGMSFMASRTLLTAVQMDLFTIIGERHMTGEEIRTELGLHSRAIPDFTDALVALGMLARDGDGPEAKYYNTPDGAQFLVKSSPTYIGGIAVMCSKRLFRFWNDLEEGLRTGAPQNESKHGGKGIFESLYADPAALEQFMNAMTGLSKIQFAAFASRFDFSRYRTLCDVGGAAGTMSCIVAGAHPHMSCISYDLPVVEPVAMKAIAEAGLSERVTTAPGDFFKDPIPRADVITMARILHDWNLDKKKHLIRAAYDALSDGGAFVSLESFIDDARRTSVEGLLMSLNMVVETGDGFDYSIANFREWCLEAGFKSVEALELGGGQRAAVAYK